MWQLLKQLWDMRAPWYCPYCDLTSSRRSNVSAHIQRKHPDRFNPMPGLKQNHPFSSSLAQAQIQSSNPPVSSSFAHARQLPNPNVPGNTSSGLQFMEKTKRFQDTVNEIGKMNAIEIGMLLQIICNLPNFKSYSNGFF